MYSFEWDKDRRRTGGYRLTTQTGKFVASEIRPVFVEELVLTGLQARLAFDPAERRPLLWAKQNVYLYCGEEIARLNKTRYGKPVDIEWKGALCGKDGSQGRAKTRKRVKLVPVDVGAMVAKNRSIVSALVADTLKRVKEMYDAYARRCNAVYIGFRACCTNPPGQQRGLDRHGIIGPSWQGSNGWPTTTRRATAINSTCWRRA